MSSCSNFWKKNIRPEALMQLSTSWKPHMHTATLFGIKLWITCLHKKTHLRCSIWFSLRLCFHLILQMGWLRFKNVRWLAEEHAVNPGQAATLPQLGDGYRSAELLWCWEHEMLRSAWEEQFVEWTTQDLSTLQHVREWTPENGHEI